jgi:hypothetical protein
MCTTIDSEVVKWTECSMRYVLASWFNFLRLESRPINVNFSFQMIMIKLTIQYFSNHYMIVQNFNEATCMFLLLFPENDIIQCACF